MWLKLVGTSSQKPKGRGVQVLVEVCRGGNRSVFLSGVGVSLLH